MTKALIITHPHEEYDHGALEDSLEEYVEGFTGDTYLVASDSCDTVYASESFDHELDEVGSGLIGDEDVESLVEQYDKFVLGGGYARQCLNNTYESISKKVGSRDIVIDSQVTYDQLFNRNNGFRLAELFERRELEEIGDYLSNLDKEFAQRLVMGGEPIEDSYNEIVDASSERFELEKMGRWDLNVGFSARPDKNIVIDG